MIGGTSIIGHGICQRILLTVSGLYFHGVCYETVDETDYLANMEWKLMYVMCLTIVLLKVCF